MSASPFIGEIMMVGFNFAPRGWAFCNGQLMSIAQNTALFSLLGTTYGGDGRVTFGLPDLRGRVPIHFGQGPGLSNYVQGEVGGAETATLVQQNMPAHTHGAALRASLNPADTLDPTNASLGLGQAAGLFAYSSQAPGADMNAGSIAVANAGGNQPFGTRAPYLALNFVIAVQGIFPSRN